MTAKGRTYKIVLRSLPATPGSVPEAQRLKGLLKVALRSFGFKCVEVSADSHEPQGAVVADPGMAAPIFHEGGSDDEHQGTEAAHERRTLTACGGAERAGKGGAT